MITAEKLKKMGVSEEDIKFFQKYPNLLKDAVIYDQASEEEALKLEQKLRAKFTPNVLIDRAKLLENAIQWCCKYPSYLEEMKAAAKRMVQFAEKGDYYHVARITLEMETMEPLIK